MKILFTTVCYLIFSSTAWPRSDGTPMSATTHGIASEALAQFEATGKWPSMEKLTSIEQYALKAKAPRELVLFNTLAGVPGTPIINAEDVEAKYSGFRLYAISRIPNLERAYTPEGKKTGGRYTVLFKEVSGKPPIMEMPWMVESEVQVILKQIGGFDPRKAPFVFEDTYVKLGGDVEKLYQNNNSEKFVKHPPSSTKSQSKIIEPVQHSSQEDNSQNKTSLEHNNKSTSGNSANETTPFSWGIIGSSVGALLIAIAAWLKLRNSNSIS